MHGSVQGPGDIFCRRVPPDPNPPFPRRRSSAIIKENTADTGSERGRHMEVLVIGGGVSNEGENLLRPLVDCVRPQLYIRTPEKQTRIVLATLGNDAGLIGAAFLNRAR